MINSFYKSILAQLIFTILFVVHHFFYPLGSDFMFGVLIVSLFVSCYLFWQIFKIGKLTSLQKLLGLISVFLPVFWLLLLIGFIS